MKNNLNKLPTIIDGPGKYKTRSNKIIIINHIRPTSNQDRLEFNCMQQIFDRFGVVVMVKSWHKSGRVSQYSVSPIDIIEKID